MRRQPMIPPTPSLLKHPTVNRREMLRAGGIGLMGLSMSDVTALRAQAAHTGAPQPPVKSVIYIFLSGGLSQHESFDMKPEAADSIRGEFRPIDTATPGIQISEHLPMLAQRSRHWALVRSLTHGHNEHSNGHHIMLTGRSEMPRGFNPSKPMPTDDPTFASIVSATVQGKNHLPSAAVIPETFIHASGRVIPGQFAGIMGPQRDPWVIDAAAKCKKCGACPNCFDHQQRDWEHTGDPVFESPNLRLPDQLTSQRLGRRLDLMQIVEDGQRHLDRAADVAAMDRNRQTAISLLTSGKVRKAFDVHAEPDEVQEAYGKNRFGWSLLMARSLIEVGVGMVQVNLGRNESWDTHGNIFPHLKNHLFPPTDRAVSALIDDLEQRGLLDSTLIVMAGEFGRTPKISRLARFYKYPGRDHWGAVQSVFFAGGGVRGGTVIGSSDSIGGYPQDLPQRPENMAATIYDALGIHREAAWYSSLNRPHFVYHADPIAGLIG
ncbi:DUF1501 domain-containing protein [Symmachiella dynata]|uniref:DUF1501 domain-containing protein n=1 Tax=Symmachiella dynata TaxID=2527995 RepID=UPI001E4EEEA2|nr:DUF1501 domain-containing protein [Symmachiella dynata]